jgi:L-asparaginase/Glu-tRNA(Gln) amidotransferase subunit D
MAARSASSLGLDPIHPDHRRRRVLIINTGGTMGMRPTAKGLAPSAGYLSERIRCMEELASDDLPLVEVLDFDPLLDSSDFSPAEWVAIARCIESNYLTYDGFVVVMGTDTLAYCASALSFMLENLAKVGGRATSRATERWRRAGEGCRESAGACHVRDEHAAAHARALVRV